MDVDMIPGHYGEFQVLVDNQVLVDGGSLAFFGVMPSGRKIVDAVRARLSGNDAN
jgi:hypothetical protein